MSSPSRMTPSSRNPSTADISSTHQGSAGSYIVLLTAGSSLDAGLRSVDPDRQSSGNRNVANLLQPDLLGKQLDSPPDGTSQHTEHMDSISAHSFSSNRHPEDGSVLLLFPHQDSRHVGPSRSSTGLSRGVLNSISSFFGGSSKTKEELSSIKSTSNIIDTKGSLSVRLWGLFRTATSGSENCDQKLVSSKKSLKNRSATCVTANISDRPTQNYELREDSLTSLEGSSHEATSRDVVSRGSRKGEGHSFLEQQLNFLRDSATHNSNRNSREKTISSSGSAVPAAACTSRTSFESNWDVIGDENSMSALQTGESISDVVAQSAVAGISLNPLARPPSNRLGTTLEAVQEGEALENSSTSNLTYGSPVLPELQPTSKNGAEDSETMAGFLPEFQRPVLASGSCKLSPIDGDVISAKMTRLKDTINAIGQMTDEDLIDPFRSTKLTGLGHGMTHGDASTNSTAAHNTSSDMYSSYGNMYQVGNGSGGRAASGSFGDYDGSSSRGRSRNNSFHVMSGRSGAAPAAFLEQVAQSLHSRHNEGSDSNHDRKGFQAASNLDSTQQKAWESVGDSRRGSPRRSVQILDDEFNFKDEPPMTGVMGSLGVGVVRSLASKEVQHQHFDGSNAIGQQHLLQEQQQNKQHHQSREQYPRRTISTESIIQQTHKPHEQMPKRTISTESLLRRQALMRQQLLTSAGDVPDIAQQQMLQKQQSGVKKTVSRKSSVESLHHNAASDGGSSGRDIGSVHYFQQQLQSVDKERESSSGGLSGKGYSCSEVYNGCQGDDFFSGADAMRHRNKDGSLSIGKRTSGIDPPEYSSPSMQGTNPHNARNSHNGRQDGHGSRRESGPYASLGSQGGHSVGLAGQLFVQDASGRLMPIHQSSDLSAPWAMMMPHPGSASVTSTTSSSWPWSGPQVVLVSIGVLVLIINVFVIMYIVMLRLLVSEFRGWKDKEEF